MHQHNSKVTRVTQHGGKEDSGGTSLAVVPARLAQAFLGLVDIARLAGAVDEGRDRVVSRGALAQLAAHGEDACVRRREDVGGQRAQERVAVLEVAA